jgi:hypothetical protein
MVLTEARSLTMGPRRGKYGDPSENMAHVAAIFNAWTGHKLPGVDVTRLLVCLKMSRRISSPLYEDHYVDGAAYTAIEFEVACTEAAGGKDPRG